MDILNSDGKNKNQAHLVSHACNFLHLKTISNNAGVNGRDRLFSSAIPRMNRGFAICSLEGVRR